MQFVTQALAPYQQQIRELGGKIYVPVPDHALIVRMNGGARRAIEQLPFVRWVGPYHAGDKLEEEVSRMVGADEPGLLTAIPERRRYSILLFEKGDAVQNLVADRIRQLGGEVDLMTASRRMEATLDSLGTAATRRHERGALHRSLDAG